MKTFLSILIISLGAWSCKNDQISKTPPTPPSATQNPLVKGATPVTGAIPFPVTSQCGTLTFDALIIQDGIMYAPQSLTSEILTCMPGQPFQCLVTVTFNGHEYKSGLLHWPAEAYLGKPIGTRITITINGTDVHWDSIIKSE